jgi:hypothetical protein
MKMISGCILIWIMANVYDRRHPKLGHPPYDWHSLRPQPSPWPVQSASLRAYMARRDSPATTTVARERDLPRNRPARTAGAALGRTPRQPPETRG